MVSVTKSHLLVQKMKKGKFSYDVPWNLKKTLPQTLIHISAGPLQVHVTYKFYV